MTSHSFPVFCFWSRCFVPHRKCNFTFLGKGNYESMQHRLQFSGITKGAKLSFHRHFKIITLLSIEMFFFFFFAALFCVYGDHLNSKQKAKQYTENLTAKLQTQIKILSFLELTVNQVLNNLAQELRLAGLNLFII